MGGPVTWARMRQADEKFNDFWLKEPRDGDDDDGDRAAKLVISRNAITARARSIAPSLRIGNQPPWWADTFGERIDHSRTRRQQKKRRTVVVVMA